MSFLSLAHALFLACARAHTHADARTHTDTHTSALSRTRVLSHSLSHSLARSHTKPQVIKICVDGENSQRIEWQLSDGQLSFNALVDREQAAGVPLHSVVRVLNWKIIRSAERVSIVI
jgi:hypothetical protein